MNWHIVLRVVGWHGGAIDRASDLQLFLSHGFESCLENHCTMRIDLRLLTYRSVPLSARSINWYRSKGGDTVRLGRSGDTLAACHRFT